MRPTARVIARLRLLGCLALTALTCSLSGCGGGGTPGPGGAAASGAGSGAGRPVTSRGAGSPDRPTDRAAEAVRAAPAGNCQVQLGRFLSVLEELRRRLIPGLSYRQYMAAIGALQAAYARLPVTRLTLACLTDTGEPAERAFDKYIEAANTWGKCLAEAGCDAATIAATLRREWAVATALLRRAVAAGGAR